MPLIGAHSAGMLVADPSALERHCSVVDALELAPGEFAVSPTE